MKIEDIAEIHIFTVDKCKIRENDVQFQFNVTRDRHGRISILITDKLIVDNGCSFKRI